MKTNVPLEAGIAYEVAPGLRVMFDGQKEVWEGDNGLVAIGHVDLHGEYTLEIENEGRMVFEPTSRAAWFDRQFVPDTLPPGIDLYRELARIRDHHKEVTSGTGEEGRGYVNVPSVVFAACANGTQELAAWRSLRPCISAMREWIREELEARPLGHHPRIYSGDQYSQKYVNQRTEREWNHQKVNVWGWNAFDTAHIFLTWAYTLAAYGDPLGKLYVALVHSWCTGSAYPGVCTNWITQPRGQGWVLDLDTWAHMLRLWPTQEVRDRFTCGFSTEEIAQLHLEHSISDHFERGIGNGDTHNSPKLRDATGKIVEVEEWAGHLPFHCGIRLWGLYRMGLSDLAPAIRRRAKQEHSDSLWYLRDGAVDFETGAMSRVLGTVRFPDQATAEAEAARATAAEGKNPWEAFERQQDWSEVLTAGWYIREQPRIQDAQMLWNAAPLDPFAERWWNRRDMPRWDYDLVAYRQFVTT